MANDEAADVADDVATAREHYRRDLTCRRPSRLAGRGYGLAGAMLAAATLESLAMGQYFFRGFRLGLRVRAAIAQLVFEKLAPADNVFFAVAVAVAFAIAAAVAFATACAAAIDVNAFFNLDFIFDAVTGLVPDLYQRRRRTGAR